MNGEDISSSGIHNSLFTGRWWHVYIVCPLFHISSHHREHRNGRVSLWGSTLVMSECMMRSEIKNYKFVYIALCFNVLYIVFYKVEIATVSQNIPFKMPTYFWRTELGRWNMPILIWPFCLLLRSCDDNISDWISTVFHTSQFSILTRQFPFE